MTLSNWSKKYGIHVSTHSSGSKHVPAEIGQQSHRDLYHLSDYKVSSVSGGTVWLRKSSKNPFLKTRRNSRSLRGSKSQIQASIRGTRSMMRGLKKDSERYKNLKSRLKGLQYSLVKAYRKTRRNEGESPKKNNLKWIIGGGIAAFALYYLLRRRASAAPAIPIFQSPTRTTPINSSVAPRIGQRFADVAKMLTDYRVPYRVVRQDGRALAVTKDLNPNRWNLTVNRGIVVAATKG